jgi:putative addiction module component (TIGR02574 family)
MSSKTVALFRQALSLDEKDRVILAGLLLDSLEEKGDPEHEALWRAEVANRLQELDRGEIEALSWDEVKSRLLNEKYAPKEN